MPLRRIAFLTFTAGQKASRRRSDSPVPSVVPASNLLGLLSGRGLPFPSRLITEAPLTEPVSAAHPISDCAPYIVPFGDTIYSATTASGLNRKAESIRLPFYRQKSWPRSTRPGTGTRVSRRRRLNWRPTADERASRLSPNQCKEWNDGKYRQ